MAMPLLYTRSGEQEKRDWIEAFISVLHKQQGDQKLSIIRHARRMDMLDLLLLS